MKSHSLRLVGPTERYTPPKGQELSVSVSKAIALYATIQKRMDEGMTLSAALRDFADYVEKAEASG